MINKIGNWVFGSFFRTIGRLLVFVLLGVIIASVVDFGDIFDNFRITDLFFENVKADTLSQSVWYTYAYNSDGTNLLPDETYAYQSMIPTLNNNSVSITSVYFTPSVTKNANYDYITIPFLISGKPWGVNSIADYDMHCSYKFDNNSQLWYPFNCNYEDSGSTTAVTDINFKFNISLIGSDGMFQSNCNIQNDKIVCYLQPGVEYNRLLINYNYTGPANNLKFNLYHAVSYYTSSQDRIIEAQEGTTNAITNQTHQQQQQHQEIMDDNTTQAEDEASDFLGNFTVEDTGGLNAIITAPLSTIQSLLNNTCNKLVLPLPFVSKNIELPCLYPIYNDYFGAFFTIYQTIILGIISYRCIKSLFFDVKGFTNPEDDRIEVMDL